MKLKNKKVMIVDLNFKNYFFRKRKLEKFKNYMRNLI